MDEAQRIFYRLGIPVFQSSQGAQEFYDYEYKFENGLSIDTELAAQDQRIETARVTIEPANLKDAITRKEWAAYSPDTLIRQYGPPSYVFLIGGGTPHEPGVKLALFYILDLYFDTADLIVEYDSVGGLVHANPATGLVHVCPLTDQFEFARVWLGKSPLYPPGSTYPIDKAASMTVGEFSALMIGNVTRACFNVNEKWFDL